MKDLVLSDDEVSDQLKRFGVMGILLCQKMQKTICMAMSGMNGDGEYFLMVGKLGESGTTEALERMTKANQETLAGRRGFEAINREARQQKEERQKEQPESSGEHHCSSCALNEEKLGLETQVTSRDHGICTHKMTGDLPPGVSEAYEKVARFALHVAETSKGGAIIEFDMHGRQLGVGAAEYGSPQMDIVLVRMIQRHQMCKGIDVDAEGEV